MTTNSYFQDLYTAQSEDQRLAQDLIVECIQIHGRDMYYLPRDLTNFDSFFGEDQSSAFNDAIQLEFYLENIQSWGDEGSFLSKFGLEVRDSATFAVAMVRFAEEVTSRYPEIRRPREGDILVLPSPFDNRKRHMEITYVKNEEIFYQLGRLYIWTITVKNFEYSGETFNTGVTEIDDYEAKYALTTEITVEAGAGAYVAGEEVSQVTGFAGNVISFADNVLVLSKVEGELNTTQALIGGTSGCSRTIATVDTEVGRDTNINDNDFTKNETQDNGLIDFSESNPFSEQ